MKILITFLLFSTSLVAAPLPSRYVELLPYVQPAPDQGETNTCLYMASTGAMELLLNKRDKIKKPKVGGKNDLSESFLIWQKNFSDPENPSGHFIEKTVKNFNHGEAIHHRHWAYNAYNEDETPNMDVWSKHPDFPTLPRVKVPALTTELLFARGRKWATEVLYEEDIETVKAALVKYRSPVIINYNDNGYWHVVLIVGYDDKAKGDCYEVEEEYCNKRGAFYVRDSNGLRYEARAYNWFYYNGNAAAVVRFR